MLQHHCRRCGNIYCSACSDEKLDLPRMCFVDPVRICSDCAPTTIQENKFFECQLKILTGGASFLLENRSDEKLLSDSSDNLVLCKLSQDHRYNFLYSSSNVLCICLHILTYEVCL